MKGTIMTRKDLIKVVFIAGFTSVCIIFMYAWFVDNKVQAAKGPDSLIVKSFTIVDKSGNTRIRLFARDEQAGIIIYDQKGTKRVHLMAQKEKVLLNLFNAKKQNQIYVAVEEEAGPFVKLNTRSDQRAGIKLGNDSSTLITMGLTDNNIPILGLYSNGYLVHGFPEGLPKEVENIAK